MRRLVAALVGVALVGAVVGQTEDVPRMPTWDDEIANGLLPYRQLTVKDFAIDDNAHPGTGFWIKVFIDPRYRCYMNSANGLIYLYIEKWVVFSGFSQKESSRKSALKDMNAELPYAQAILDINELYARQLAALQPGDLPSGHGATLIAAQADLASRIRVFCGETYERVQSESKELAAATKSGQNKKKVRELAMAIRKRLNAVPTPSPASVSPTPSPTASVTH
jgi:hypothetical protein